MVLAVSEVSTVAVAAFFFPPHEAASRATLASTITAAIFTLRRLRDQASSRETTPRLVRLT